MAHYNHLDHNNEIMTRAHGCRIFDFRAYTKDLKKEKIAALLFHVVVCVCGGGGFL